MYGVSGKGGMERGRGREGKRELYLDHGLTVDFSSESKLTIKFLPVVNRRFFIFAISVTNTLPLISGHGLKFCIFKMLPAPM